MVGSVRAINDSAGQVVARFEYEPFGLLSMSTGSATSGAHRFTGKPQDSGTGLYYFGARYYDPQAGRFISRDPARDGLNWFEYCHNNPTLRIDPSGLHSVVYSHDVESIYWIDDDGRIVKLWSCSEKVDRRALNEFGQPRESLPNGTYTARASEPGVKYGEAYGTFYIDTGDYRGRDIHGGGSKLADPYAPRQDRLKPTLGCLRMYNSDGEELSQLIIDHGNDVPLTVQSSPYAEPPTYGCEGHSRAGVLVNAYELVE